MKPVFFPFTLVTETAVNQFAGFFKKIAFYQPSPCMIPDRMKEWIEDRRLDPWFPDSELSKKIDAAMKAYRNQAQYHREGESSFLKGCRNTIPFFEADSVFQIIKDIRSAGEPKTRREGKENPILTANIFLSMAQEFDEQNLSIAHHLMEQEREEEDLYSRLKGDEAPRKISPRTGRSMDNPFDYMLKDRLGAWSRIMVSGFDCTGPFITSSPGVVALIRDSLSATEKMLHAASFSALEHPPEKAARRQADLMHWFVMLSDTPASVDVAPCSFDNQPASSERGSCLNIYIVPDIAPYVLFSRLANGKDQADPHESHCRVRNTIIGCLCNAPP